ncbi:sensor histidine kinase [Blautia sp. MSJ-19]|uniref:sensor histidine kinase n=1 Tax=Blautia sp. MSJ-19 TaxID=2841517 RepID=UPI0020A1F279|nr:histidine kinase [Blautia sp. MSJ-19]
MADFLLGSLTAAILEKKTRKYNKKDNEIRRIMDTGEEKTILLSEKNRALAEKQNSEIYAATLRERNRIAREIHDNVGHVLSRTILLTGAIRAINKDPNLDNLLTGLDGSLNSAMNSIRSSVHDLHDDAINLEETIKNIISDFKRENVEMEYDMSEIIPSNIKYCFISITKEALSNADKYSNATRIKITMREHPAMYQLCIKDNGKGCRDYAENSTGIGLKNMQERVTALNGTLQIDGEKGFQIFIIIPKQTKWNLRENEGL